MKRILTITAFLVCFISCKKDIGTVSKPIAYLDIVANALKDSIDSNTFQALDFTKAVKTKVNNDTAFVRIPFKDVPLQNRFVLVQTDELGHINRGRKVSLNKENTAAARLKKYRPYYGHIIIQELKGKKLIDSEIENGYIVALHPKRKNNRETVVLPVYEYEELPEVIVIGYREGGGGGTTFGDWISFSGMFGGTYSTSNYYGSMDGYSYGGGGGGYYSDNGYNYTVTPMQNEAEQKNYNYWYEEPAILVDYEESFNDPAINIQQYLKCFSNLSDAGATCSIEIFADIPVDSDPNKLLNWQTRSPGHTFVQITKSNGGQRISQNIGFYPSQGWKVSLTNASVDGKFVDNAGHEFNASLKMNISPQQLQNAVLEMQRLASKQYDIDEYNCTDFAMDVFNAGRNIPLEIPLYDIPGAVTAGGSRTPQGLYNKLKEMKANGDPESNNIIVDIYKAWVGASNGPCN